MVLARMVARKLAKFESASRLNVFAGQRKGIGSRSHLVPVGIVEGYQSRSQGTLQTHWSHLGVKHQEDSRGQSVR